MKKFLNRMAKKAEEYEYEEAWDDVEDLEYEEGGYSEEEYYAGEEDEYSEEEYYAEEEDKYSEEEYYVEEESEYSEEEYYAGEEDQYAEEEYYAGEESEYAEEEYYADEYEASYYEADDVEYIEGLEEEEDAAWDAASNENFFRKIITKFARMDMVDRVITCTGVAVLVLALVTGSVFAGTRITHRQVDSFATLGNQLEDITVIGGEGLLAVADARLAGQEAADLVEEEQESEEYAEEEYSNEVTVALKMTSIKKDLKIKIVNQKTGKLISNVPFEVTVTDSKGKASTWKDEDKDGIIYKTDLVSGNYTVALNELAGADYGKYKISTIAQSAKVKENLDYEKVDVSDEIKNESEIDASKEDTAKNDVEEESRLQDTVEWVESTKTPIGDSYQEVNKNTIEDPAAKVAKLGNVIKWFQAAVSPVAGNRLPVASAAVAAVAPAVVTMTPPTAMMPVAAALNPVTAVTVPDTGSQAGVKIAAIGSLPAKGTASLSAAVSNFPEGAAISYSWSANGAGAVITANGSSAELQVNNTETSQATVEISVTATATVEEEVSGNSQQTVYTATDKISVTVEAASPVIEPVTLSQTTLELAAGASTTLKATQKGNTEFTWKSSDEKIVTVSSQGAVKAVKAGTAVITVTGANGQTATCTVTVKNNAQLDTTTALKDKSGNQIYVKNEKGEYVAAVYADYYKANQKFYVKQQQGYKYTGWQTLDGKVYFFDGNGNKITGQQVIQGVQYNFDGNGVLVSSNGVLGIDVSKWNGNIDWNAVKNSGVSYVIIRCGYRGSSQGSLIEDPKYKSNIQGATKAGLKVGVYFFTQAVNEIEAVEEASMVLSLIKGYKLSYPVFLDVESSGGRADSISKETRTAVCKAFCQTIKNSGYAAGVYANKTWLNSYIDAGQLGAYRIWLAQYASQPSYAGRYDMWQYSSKGKVSGISGNVDMNLSYMGY